MLISVRGFNSVPQCSIVARSSDVLVLVLVADSPAFYLTTASFVSVVLFSRGFIDLFLQLVKEETQRIVISQRVARSSRILRHKIDKFLRGLLNLSVWARFRARQRGRRRRLVASHRGTIVYQKLRVFMCLRRRCEKKLPRAPRDSVYTSGIDVGREQSGDRAEREQAFTWWNWFHGAPNRHYLRRRSHDLRFADQLWDYWQENTEDAFHRLIIHGFQATRVGSTSSGVAWSISGNRLHDSFPGIAFNSCRNSAVIRLYHWIAIFAE